MKSVFCEPAVNEVYDPVKQCKRYETEIEFLKNELAMHDTLTNRSQVVYEPLSETQHKELKQQVEKFLAREISEIEIINIRQIKEMLEMFRNIVSTIEYETEKRLREKYVLQEKSATDSHDIHGKLTIIKFFIIFFSFINNFLLYRIAKRTVTIDDFPYVARASFFKDIGWL